MHVGVVFATAIKQVWLKLDVPDGSTVEEAISISGITTQFPEIDLEAMDVGIFGKIKDLDTKLEEGDRVEIYRPITADPETAERKNVSAD